MTTMLEKAARAIYARKYGDHDPWDEATARMARLGMDRLSNNQAEAVADARAALLAIRDLDSGDSGGGLAALVAGKQALYSCCADPELQDARGCFHAMIDAILNEKPGGVAERTMKRPDLDQISRFPPGKPGNTT